MLEALGPGTRLGYCTNVHAGHDYASTLANLELHSVAVREALGVGELGVGLWLSAEAASEALESEAPLRERLRELGLKVFTLNGFPFGNFHGPVVKHRVYEPSWSHPGRAVYTLDLAAVLNMILDEGEEGSISTLPLGWPSSPCEGVDRSSAAQNLREIARRLAILELNTGRFIHLDLEPEPGCILQRATDVVRFWEEHLLRGHTKDERAIRRHVRVCHDVCHAAVMFEDQVDEMRRYEAAGVSIGKVQVSSALRVAVQAGNRSEVLSQLAAFHEPRYLHQTAVRTLQQPLDFFEDLPPALDAVAASHHAAEARVHFHVPIHMNSLGLLGTTQDQILPCIAEAGRLGVRHFEVETYAWTALPPHLQPPDLARGIADELRWLTAAQISLAPERRR